MLTDQKKVTNKQSSRRVYQWLQDENFIRKVLLRCKAKLVSYSCPMGKITLHSDLDIPALSFTLQFKVNLSLRAS